MDARWLRALGEHGLAGVLARRPEVTTPAPSSLAELAVRLSDPANVLAALRRLVLPSAQVAEAIAALPPRTDRATLLRLLAATQPAAIAAVDHALADLTEHALLTVDGDSLSLSPTVRYAWDSPLGLGPPIEELTAGVSSGLLKAMGERLGVPRSTRNGDLVAAITAAMRDSELIQSIVATAPSSIRELLFRVAASGEHVMLEPVYGIMHPGWTDPLMQWATERGLLMPLGPWGGELVMPTEVTLSLRGPDYAAPFEPVEPACSRAAVDPATVARDASAAAGAFLRLAAHVMDEASRARVATIRAGGVGVRELRRLAKICAADLDDVRLVLAVLHRAGLLAGRVDGATPTADYDAWLAEEPPDRLATLILAWWTLPYAPRAAEGGGWIPSEVDNGTKDLRAGMLRLLAAEPGAPIDTKSFVELLRWRHPHLLRAGFEAFTAVVAACRVEASLLGIVGAGAVSDAGLALLANDPAALIVALAGVGRSVSTAHLQADLTAVVSGTPSPALAEVLTAVADRESSGAASVWRFSPDSVRRALDTGWTADAVLTELETIATNGVPQPLAYLVRDVERRHGLIRGSTVVCCLRSDDTALLAELAADRRLRGLGLRLLAPTVLAGVKPLSEAIAALRKAGYAPVEEAADGTAVVEKTTRRRAALPHPRSAASDASARSRGVDSLTDGRALARTLLDRPDGKARSMSTGPMRRSLSADDGLELDNDFEPTFRDDIFGGGYRPPNYPRDPRLPWRRRWY